MTLMEKIRTEAMTLSTAERANLAHDLILSLDAPNAYELSPGQESEICRRVQMVREGTASGRSASDVVADIKATYS